MQGYHKKPKQTRWGPRTPGELLNDAYKGREAKRWLDSANAANKKQKEFKIAEENRKRDAKLFKGPLTKDQILGTGKYFKNSLPFIPWNNKPKQKTSVTNKKNNIMPRFQKSTGYAQPSKSTSKSVKKVGTGGHYIMTKTKKSGKTKIKEVSAKRAARINRKNINLSFKH